MTDLFDRQYKKYDEWYEKNRFAYLSELEAIKKVLPKKGRGLEIGVGTGRFAAPLGIEYGIDPSGKMLGIARSRKIRVKKGSGEKLPFPEAYFDYAAVIFTLCFVRNPQKVLEESYRVLKHGGKLILGIIDRKSFLGRHYMKQRKLFYKKARFFPLKEIMDMLKTAGFRKISCYQALFDFPENINYIEMSEKGYGRGGFTVISSFRI